MGNKFSSIANYTKYIKQNFKTTATFRVGNFYSYFYLFDKTLPFDTIKYYDLFPLVFVYEFRSDIKGLFRGINFHHLPVEIRLEWFELINNMFTDDIKRNRILFRLADWNKLFRMFKRASKASVRQYYMQNIRELRKVPARNMKETLKYYAKTYYGVNISQVETKYLLTRI